MRRWIFLIVLVLVAAGAAVLVNVGLKGESQIEQWVGSELKRFIKEGNRFTLEFSSIDYQYPNRAVMQNMRLSLAGGNGELGPLIEIGKGTIELAKTPRWGEPLVIKTVNLVDPVVRVESFIAAAKRPDTKREATTQRSLSSILTLRRIEIANGEIRYDDGKGSPLSWTKLNARLDLETSDQKWHAVRMVIDQSPLMKVELAGELNIDSAVARNIDVKGSLNLSSDPAALQFFTPPLQRLMAKYEVRGQLGVRVKGLLDAKQKENTGVEASFQMTDGNVSAGAYHLPVQRITAQAKLRGSLLTVEPLEIEALSGTLTSKAEARLDGNREVTAQLIATNINLRDMLRAKSESSESGLAGTVSADLRVNSNMSDLRSVAKGESDGTRWGSGYIRLREGRLLRLPVVQQVMFATRQVTGVFGGSGQNHDSLEAEFLLIDQVLDVGGMLFRGDAVGVRGKGRIGMNGEMSLLVNAGPLERLQASLGAVGNAWGKLTDSLMGYSVKGTIKKPIVKPIFGSG